jgi:branched-chain amino acid transport system ATP-binding protein
VTPLLALQDVNTAYGAVQVHFDLSLTVGQGQIVCLLGGNASGKSTTMKVILGLVRPRSGTVLFDGAPITGLPTAQIIRRGIGSVPEARRLFATMTVRENLLMGAYRRTDKPGIAEDYAAMLALFPRVGERLGQRAGTLSGGEQQMVAIGRGLASAPKLLMLDEPSMGLAPAVTDTIFERISQIHADGVTILLVEQRVAEALELSDHGYVLETGHMVLQGPYETLLADDRVRKSYLGLTDE